MAKPKKAKTLQRTHPVMLRFTDTEYERLLSHAEAAGLPLAEYIRKIARYFNSGGIHSQEMRTRINHGISDIYEMKYGVLKMAG